VNRTQNHHPNRGQSHGNHRANSPTDVLIEVPGHSATMVEVVDTGLGSMTGAECRYGRSLRRWDPFSNRPRRIASPCLSPFAIGFSFDHLVSQN
jgi:hypothetical protein